MAGTSYLGQSSNLSHINHAVINTNSYQSNQTGDNDLPECVFIFPIMPSSVPRHTGFHAEHISDPENTIVPNKTISMTILWPIDI